MILTRDQRWTFVAWLESEIQSDKTLIEQMKKLGGLRIMHETRQQELQAKQTVLKILTGIES